MGQVIPLGDAQRKFYEDYGADLPQGFSGTSEELVQLIQPGAPLYIIRPQVLKARAEQFVSGFPGRTCYAVKTNPDANVLTALHDGGVREFDVASLAEIQQVFSLFPESKLHFMHPVKSREAIYAAYHNYGVRSFVLDCEDELKKIVGETGLSQDLELFIRMALPKNTSAHIDFSSKFGASFAETVALLQKCRPLARKLGLSFHVGTQTADPEAYAKAVQQAAKAIRESGVDVDILDVGGGFAVPYPGQTVQPLEANFAVITRALKDENLQDMPLLAEPGRCLVAEAGSLVARVELRKGDLLFLNDGTYGGLFDAGPLLKDRFPVKAHRAQGGFVKKTQDFRFAGPTCDSLDMMDGPFTLPADIRMGDWIEIGNLGAYSQVMRTDFNGFGHAEMILLNEK